MKQIRRDQTVFRFGDGYRVARLVIRREVELESLRTRERHTLSMEELHREVAAGVLTSARAVHCQLLASALLGIPHRPVGVPTTHRWNVEIRRLSFIHQLGSAGSFDMPWRVLQRHVIAISKERNERSPPHDSTLRRWRALYRQAQHFSVTALGRTASATPRHALNPVVRHPGGKPTLRVVR